MVASIVLLHCRFLLLWLNGFFFMNKSGNISNEALRRGGATVGYMADIRQEEAIFISYFRTFCSGYESRISLQNLLLSNLGTEDGYATMDALDKFCEIIYKKGRRRFTRHDVACECIGADENCLSQFVFSACEDTLEDAHLMGTLITDAFLSNELTLQARKIGLSIRAYLECIEKVPPKRHAWIKEFFQVN